MGRKFIVQYDRDGCIGAGSCVAADSDNWSMNDDGKADLREGRQEEGSGVMEREIDESELPKMREAAQSCPVNVIRIRDKQTGKSVL